MKWSSRARVLLQVALAALSLAVIGLTSKALNGLDNDRHKLQQQLPGGNLEAKPMVGVGIVLAIVCGGIILHAVRIPYDCVTTTRKLPQLTLFLSPP
jgi:hypothetical protein